MTFWKRAALPPPVSKPMLTELELRTQAAAGAEGTERCTERGCAAQNAINCQYVDRRNRACRSAWCPEHRIVIDGQIYCRRHGGVVGALPGGSRLTPFPDLENRAPSLVSWVAREVDVDVRRLLLAEVALSDDAQLVADAVFLNFIGADRLRVWERGWRIATHTGMTLRVALQVAEADDSEVIVRVGAQIVDQVVPPWILQRRDAEVVVPELDAHRRREFNRRVIAAVAAGLAHERSVGL